MLPDYEIVLGKGIGRILFGISKEEMDEILGSPDEIEQSDDPARMDLETYCYNSIRCSFSFDPIFNGQLVEIFIENDCFHICHKIRVGLKKHDLLKLGNELNFGEHRIEEIVDEDLIPQELITFNNVGLQLLLDVGVISAIIIKPYVSEDFISNFDRY